MMAKNVSEVKKRALGVGLAEGVKAWEAQWHGHTCYAGLPKLVVRTHSAEQRTGRSACAT